MNNYGVRSADGFDFHRKDGQSLGHPYGFLTVWGTDCRVGFASSQ